MAKVMKVQKETGQLDVGESVESWGLVGMQTAIK